MIQVKVSLTVIGGFDCVTTVNCRICHNIFCFVLIVAFADEKLLAALRSIFCLGIAKLSAIGILFILNSSRACLASVTHFSVLFFLIQSTSQKISSLRVGGGWFFHLISSLEPLSMVPIGQKSWSTTPQIWQSLVF